MGLSVHSCCSRHHTGKDDNSPAIPHADHQRRDETPASLVSGTPIRPHCPHLDLLLQQLVLQLQRPLSSPGSLSTFLADRRRGALSKAQLRCLGGPWGWWSYLYPPCLWNLTFSYDLHLLHCSGLGPCSRFVDCISFLGDTHDVFIPPPHPNVCALQEPIEQPAASTPGWVSPSLYTGSPLDAWLPFCHQ